MLVLTFAACGSTAARETTAADTQETTTTAATETTTEVPETTTGETSGDYPAISGLQFEGETELRYAQGFHIYRYEGGYRYVTIQDGDSFLVVPENGIVPEGLPAEAMVLQQPLACIYMAASAPMSLFQAVDALDHIRFSGTKAGNWYIEGAAAAMETGDILYAGKYSDPDYELLISQNCDLAIESTMIFHAPKVKEMIEQLHIPVLVDRSSNEPHPLGRTEWVKLYAVLTGKEAEAEAFFEEQAQVIEEMEGYPRTDKTVAYFYINSDGEAVIRNPNDYVSKIIGIGGADYAFADLETTEKSSTIAITMETFYAMAVDADYLIYNGDMEGEIHTIADLVAKDALFANFKAVKEGNVWCAGKDSFQRTDLVGQMIRDIHLLLTDGDPGDMTFLKKIS